MPDELFIAIVAGLGGMLGWGFADFFAKKTIDQIGDVTTLFWAQLIGVIPLAILFLFNPTVPEFSGIEPLYLVSLGVWSGLSYIPAYVAFGKGKVSILSPIFASYAVIVALLSSLIFKEVIPFSRQLSFLVVFIGILMINTNPGAIIAHIKGGGGGKLAKVKGLPEILLAVGLYSIWLLALDNFLGSRNWVPILLIIRAFSAISLFFWAKLTQKKLEFTKKGIWKFLLPIGVFDVAAFSFVSYGFSTSSFTSVVAMLAGAFSLPTIILARVFLKERVSAFQTIGSLIIIAGIVLISILN